MSLYKIMICHVFAFSFVCTDSYAYCAKCAAIEKQREEEKALKGSQPPNYYDQDHRDKITFIEEKQEAIKK